MTEVTQKGCLITPAGMTVVQMNKKTRSKNLSDSDIERIVEIVDGWDKEDITWNSLIEEIARRMFRRYVKQTLYKKERIRHALNLARERLGIHEKTSQRPISREMKIVLDQNVRLKAENERIKAENNKLLEQTVVWLKNAYDRGLTVEILNRPLPTANRGQTKRK